MGTGEPIATKSIGRRRSAGRRGPLLLEQQSPRLPPLPSASRPITPSLFIRLLSPAATSSPSHTSDPFFDTCIPRSTSLSFGADIGWSSQAAEGRAIGDAAIGGRLESWLGT